jgi:hypothetical protein
LVLYDSGASDFADHPSADLGATLEQLVERQRELSGTDSWGRLVELLRAEGLDQPWTLEAWREATTIADDGAVAVRASAEARGAAVYRAMRGRPSERWPVLATAGIPTPLVLATEPPEAVRRTSGCCPASSRRFPGRRWSGRDAAIRSLRISVRVPASSRQAGCEA